MTVLAVDAMYFHAAQAALKRAAAATKAIDKAEARVVRHQDKIDRLDQLSQLDDAAYYDKFEPLAIQMENIEYGVSEAYGPFLQHLATVHVFAVATLEAYVNTRGQELLAGRMLKAFDRLSLDAKWLYLPRLQGYPGFDPGAQPFQGFAALLQIRNKLVHYRVQREPWRGSAVPPEFLTGLGLSLKTADSSVTTTREMVKELARQLGDRQPWWLDAESPSYFEIEIEKERPAETEHRA